MRRVTAKFIWKATEPGLWLADSPPKKFIYTSSTSVYGQNDGSVVTEKSPAEPEADTAKVLVEAEKMLLMAGGSRGRSPRQNFPAVDFARGGYLRAGARALV